jgi:hypothetical protein
MASSTKLSDNSEITIPIRNLIALIIATAIGVMSYSNITKRLSFLEHSLVLQSVEVEQNSEFRTLWPRGDLGALPDDAEQNIRLTFLEKQLEGVLEKMRADEE